MMGIVDRNNDVKTVHLADCIGVIKRVRGCVNYFVEPKKQKLKLSSNASNNQFSLVSLVKIILFNMYHHPVVYLQTHMM